MGLFSIGGGSSQKTTTSFRDEKIGASDQAVVVAPKVGNSGKDARLNTSFGGAAVQGSGNTVNVTTTDDGAVDAAIHLVGAALTSQASLATEAIGSANATNAQLQDLATTRLTDGQNIVAKNAVWIILGVAALVAVVFISRRKS